MSDESMSLQGLEKGPYEITDDRFRYDAFADGSVLHGKKKNHLPAMGWNSWNAFGSQNTEALTKEMADAMVNLGLDQLGYQYVVLDDGCYKPERVNGELANEDVKFPSGFRALSDYIHAKGLKFGMYNDIGTNLCAGAAVGTCFHEETDAASYVKWGVDFLKVDNCYYLWDNATFSDEKNAKYVYAPQIKSVRINRADQVITLAAIDGRLVGPVAEKKDDIVTGLGTYDGTGPENTPIGEMSSELQFEIDASQDETCTIAVLYASGKEVGIGQWLQLAVSSDGASVICYDDLLAETETTEDFVWSQEIPILLKAGTNVIRLMNHRRQENTLLSYAILLEKLKAADPETDIIFSICEWGKTQPQNWGYKVGDSWRILNDITFQVGADGDPGVGGWTSDYTVGIASQYNKAVIMDEFAGLEKGWNDPDMLVIGMNGVSATMSRTHMAMWCMMNAPLMLGMDLRRVKKGDEIHQIIANEKLIRLNQDSLGMQAKRVKVLPRAVLEGKEMLDEKLAARPDKIYIRDNDRVDIVAKPLSDGSFALSFFNLSDQEMRGDISIEIGRILDMLGDRMPQKEQMAGANRYQMEDLWSGEKHSNETGIFEVSHLQAYDNVTWKVTRDA